MGAVKLNFELSIDHWLGEIKASNEDYDKRHEILTEFFKQDDTGWDSLKEYNLAKTKVA